MGIDLVFSTTQISIFVVLLLLLPYLRVISGTRLKRMMEEEEGTEVQGEIDGRRERKEVSLFPAICKVIGWRVSLWAAIWVLIG